MLAMIILLYCNDCQRGRLVEIHVRLFRTQSLVGQPPEHLISEIGGMIQIVR